MTERTIRKCWIVAALSLSACGTAPKNGLPAVITTPVPFTSVQYVKIDPQLTTKGRIYHRKDESFGEYWTEAHTNTPALEACYGQLDSIATIEGSEK